MQQPGLDKRHRDLDGEIHKKRSDTKVATLRKIYGEDFLADFRSDARLGTVQKRTGQTLTSLVRRYRSNEI